MTLVSQYNKAEVTLSFIFEWNKRYEEVQIVRITRDLPMFGYDKQPYSGVIREYGREVFDYIFGYRPEDELRKLPTGRYHWKGYETTHKDYWTGEVDWEWHTLALERLR